MSGLRSAVEDHISVDRADIPTDDLHSVARETAEMVDRLSVFLAQVTEEARHRGEPERDGFGSATAWLAAHVDWDHAIAKRVASLGRVLRQFPVTAAKANDGSLSSARLGVLARAASRFNDHYQHDEAMLLEFSRDLSLRDLRRAVDHWGNLVEAVTAEEEALDRANRAYLYASPTVDGWVKIDGFLDKERGETILTALDTAMMPEARETGSAEDTRHPSRRRVDALTDICRQFLDNYPGEIGGNRPHVSLLVDAQTIRSGDGRVCELTFTGTITPETARRILCDAVVTPIIVNSEGQPLWLGRSVRTATPAQRRALDARDKGCRWAGCDRPPQWCDAHHIDGWSEWDGKTDIDRLVLYCRRHHILAHRLEGRDPPS
jgi:hypothetical protein